MKTQPVTGPSYPKWKYSQSQQPVLVNTPAEEKRLVGEWADSPDFGPPKPATPLQAAADAAQKAADDAQAKADDLQVKADLAQKKADDPDYVPPKAPVGQRPPFPPPDPQPPTPNPPNPNPPVPAVSEPKV